MLKVRVKGDFGNTEKFLGKLENKVSIDLFEKYGREGVAALKSATPVDSGLTAESWYYTVERQNGSISLNFHNSNINDGVPIAIILQYGHATRNGGWVEGIDYINPALEPIFEKLANDAWLEFLKR